jgi:hypothetical protein
MKRKVSILLLLAGLTGSSSPALAGNFMSAAWNTAPEGACSGVRMIPESQYVGAYGQPMQLQGPGREPTGADYARAMLQQHYPQEVIQQAYRGQPGPTPLLLTSGLGHGPTVPGPPPPPGGPGNPPGAVAAIGALGPGQHAPYTAFRTEVRFVGPAGMRISWYAPRPDGRAGFTSQYLEAPARYNFIQAAIYRLKLSDIPNRPGVELYPTLEVVPCTERTATFLAHAAVPVNFTEDDFEQVAAGNFIVKVIYLPDPQFQDLAATGPDEVVSSRLEPGVDPIIEAKRRGSILAIIRLGNIDLEAPNTPPMDAPPANGHNGMPGSANNMPGYMNNTPRLPMPVPTNAGNGMSGRGMPVIPGMPIPGMPIPGAPGAAGMPQVPPSVNPPPVQTTPVLTPAPPATSTTPTPTTQGPAAAPAQPVAAASQQPASPPPSQPRSWRNTLADLLGRPTTER